MINARLHRRRNLVRLGAALCACAWLGAGCVLSSQGENPAGNSAPADPSKSELLGSASDQGNTDVPLGCSRVWSPAQSDSVLDCPELLPPRAPK